VTERLQFHAPPDVMRRLNKGLGSLVLAGAQQAAAASGSSDDPVLLDDDANEPVLDDDEDDSGDCATVERGEVDEERMRNEFRNQMDSTGVRSAVRGVVALTATPAACGHDLSEGASQVKHHICAMEHPSNYVGYSFNAASYAERNIEHACVPDRKQITAIKKTPIYREVLSSYGWWDTPNDKPMLPFKRRADGAIVAPKKELSDLREAGDVSSRELWEIVDKAHMESAKRGDKVLESDGVGIAVMLESMSQKPASIEEERRALIVSNYTKTEMGKLRLAQHILEGDLTFENGAKLPESCVCGLFIIVFDHKNFAHHVAWQRWRRLVRGRVHPARA